MKRIDEQGISLDEREKRRQDLIANNGTRVLDDHNDIINRRDRRKMTAQATRKDRRRMRRLRKAVSVHRLQELGVERRENVERLRESSKPSKLHLF